MPIHVIHGKSEGPTLLICSTIHGDELNGIEIIRRLLKRRDLHKIKGTLILIPVVNVLGFMSRSRYLPDRRDLNRSFPGSKSGSMASRLAYQLMAEIIPHGTHVIDLHTAAVNRENLPQIRAKLHDCPETEEMAKAFGVPVILNSEMRDGSLRQAVLEDEIPVLLYEAGEALRFDEVAIRAGVRGIINVMRYLGMLTKVKRRKGTDSVIARKSQWVRAKQSGILRCVSGIGNRVSRGEVIGYINDSLGQHEVEIVSPVSGIIIGKINLPLVHEGEAIYHIAAFSDAEYVCEQIETYTEEIEPQSDDDQTDIPALI